MLNLICVCAFWGYQRGGAPQGTHPGTHRHVELRVFVYCELAFTRYCFTSTRLCTNQSSFHSSGPPALPTLLQYYRTTIRQYTTPPTPLLYAIHHPILVIRISCKGQVVRGRCHTYIPTYRICGAKKKIRYSIQIQPVL